MTGLKIIEPSTGVEISTIENVLDPLVVEEINGAYTFQFDTIYDATTKNILRNYLEVDGDYFQALRMNRNLNRQYSIGCEHVSYILNEVYNSDLTEFEGTARDMLEAILAPLAGWFSLGIIADTEVKYYRSNPNDSARKRIIDIANLFGLEIIWYRYTISLVNKRGNNLGTSTNVEFRSGFNLVDIQEEYDLTVNDEETGFPIASYDVDIVDLAHLPGYENLASAELGDDVHVKADVLDLDFYSRIVYREYNPFQKANARVQIGRVKRDITDYLKDEDTALEEQEDVNRYLESFKIGDVECLETASDEKEQALKYLKGEIDKIVPSSTHVTDKQLTGIFANLKSSWTHLKMTLIHSKNDGNGNYTTTVEALTDVQATTKVPLKNSDYVTLVVSFYDWSYLKDSPTRAENSIFHAFGVKVEGDNITPAPTDTWLSQFQLGDVAGLALENVAQDLKIATETAEGAYVEYANPPLNGLFLALKDEFAGCSVKLKSITEHGEMTIGEIPLLNLGTPYAGLGYLNEWEFPVNANKTEFEITLMVSETVDVNELDYGFEGQLYKVKFVDKTPLNVVFEVYCFDETKGEIIKIEELTYTEPGTYEVNPPSIEGYVLSGDYETEIINITKDTVPYQIWFYYKKINTDPSVNSKYKMEFGMSELQPEMEFMFENTEGYSYVGSVVVSVTGALDDNDVDLATTLIEENGRYTGLKVTSDRSRNGAFVSANVVCFDER